MPVLLTLALLLVLGAVFALWVRYDNSRFRVVEQEIVLDNLPEAFDGYRIVHISDLHEYRFGEKQADLLAAINAMDYDCVVFTGDMCISERGDITSFAPVMELLEGMKNKETVLWVDGNNDPFGPETLVGRFVERRTYTGALTEFGQAVERAGAKILLAPFEVRRGEDSIWFVPELSLIDLERNYYTVTDGRFKNRTFYRAAQAYAKQLRQWHDELDGNGQVKIRLCHFPIEANLTQEMWDERGYIDYDLSLSGHYHAGQFRLPLIGALFVPTPPDGTMNGYFPKNKHASGLNEILGMKQYISAGLGASDTISFLQFRLFNTPQLPVLTLRAPK